MILLAKEVQKQPFLENIATFKPLLRLQVYIGIANTKIIAQKGKMKYKFILKRDLQKYLNNGWEFVKDIDQFITCKTMKEYIGFEECLVMKGDENECIKSI